MPKMPVPFWDDVMALSLDNRKVLVVNTDMLVWKTDIPQGMTAQQAARKAVVMNFSDLAAKGVRPNAFIVSLGLPNDLSISIVEEMAKGFEAGAREYDSYVIGGDTNEAGEIIINGIALGIAEEDRLMKRDGAKPGDILATTGLFGDTSAALKILLEGYSAPEVLRKPLLNTLYVPRAKVEEGIALSESGCVSASIDSSDGLAMSLYDLSKSSRVGFRLTSLPISPLADAFSELFQLDSKELALYGGEEYELIFTIKPNELEATREALKRVECTLIEFGEVTASNHIILAEEGVEKLIEKRGWEHFR
jgi:thiamine-monophosphate kinase